MAFLDHIDPGNSGGSVIIPDTSYKPAFKPVVFRCSLCDMTFKEQPAMTEHRIAEHPIKRPMLEIDGQALREQSLNIRTKISPESIGFKDVDAVYVDDKLVEDHQQLIEWLCSSSPVVFSLRLVNQNFPVEYRWNIDIADPLELDEVDKQFYNAFNSGLEMATAFRLFNERACDFSSSAKNYAAGLSCYVTAVMTKDQLPGATLSYEKYAHKLGESMDILCDYRQRPLSDAIFSIVEFTQNDFSLLSSDNTLPKLEATKCFFNNGLFVAAKTAEYESRSIPVDSATAGIVNFCSSTDAERINNIRDIEILLHIGDVDSRDRMKATFILWCFYNAIADIEKTNELRGRLVHNKHFGSLVDAIEGFNNE